MSSELILEFSPLSIQLLDKNLYKKDMDSLEKYIKNHREAFDSETPDLKVWAAIDKQLECDRPKPIRRFLFGGWKMGIAASMLLVVGCLAGLFFSGSPGTETSNPALANLSPEFKEAEQFYRNQYYDKRAQLASFPVESSLEADLKEFEQIITDMKIDLQNVPSGNRERIISAIIKNYQTKIEVLERVLDRLQNIESEHSNTKKDEISI